jgi:hypothetical protein
LLAGKSGEILLPHRKHNSTKEGLEPLRLRGYLVAHPVGLARYLEIRKGGDKLEEKF